MIVCSSMMAPEERGHLSSAVFFCCFFCIFLYGQSQFNKMIKLTRFRTLHKFQGIVASASEIKLNIIFICYCILHRTSKPLYCVQYCACTLQQRKVQFVNNQFIMALNLVLPHL